MSDFKTALFIGALAAMVAAPFVLLIAWLPLRRKDVDDEVTHAERMAVLRNTLIAVVLVGAATTGAYLVFIEEGTGGPVDASGGMGVPPGMGGGTMGSAPLPQLPGELAGLPQTEVLSGEQASSRLVTMNPGGEYPITGAEVATYSNGSDSVELRVIVLPAPEMAEANAQTLVASFSGGQMPFSKPKDVGGGVYITEGPSGTNYFFPAGSALWWVAGSDADLAEKALEQAKQLAG